MICLYAVGHDYLFQCLHFLFGLIQYLQKIL